RPSGRCRIDHVDRHPCELYGEDRGRREGQRDDAARHTSPLAAACGCEHRAHHIRTLIGATREPERTPVVLPATPRRAASATERGNTSARLLATSPGVRSSRMSLTLS